MSVNPVFTRSITRSRLSDEIVTIIQQQIMSGMIAPGTRLPTERDLAESFKVNRTTIREALRKLENLDLLDINHGDGVYARNYLESGSLDLIKMAIYSGSDNCKSLLDILEVRRIIVPEMASLAAKRRTAADLEDLRYSVLKADLTMLERDIKVHQMIARCTHNLLCTIILNFFNQVFRDYGYLYFDDERNVTRSRTFHHEILEAVKNRQPEEACRIMQDVLSYAEKAVRSAMAARTQKES
ncbi:MAG: FadR/GntR family transcriptional regulator [Smithellaceae bacterium]|nr:FadR/GntR family transcriptional regulator [Smithellaceae bacterium]